MHAVAASRVSLLLRLLPRSLLAALDRWSYHVAQRRAQRRREAVLRRKAAAAQ